MTSHQDSKSWRVVSTSHGDLAVADTGGGGTPVLMIHGNSSCRDVFSRQVGSELSRNHRFITFDLPGHGQSTDAPEPRRTYSRPGLADCAIELLARLGVSEVILLGWSLGGHVAIEMLSRLEAVKGVVISGAPPVRPARMSEGFLASPANGLAGRGELTELEAQAFAEKMFGSDAQRFLRSAILRTDPRFRPYLFEALRAGEGADQRRTVETSLAPIAVINGETDPLVRLDYFDEVAYGNLWKGRCHRLPPAGHAPFWQASARFNVLLDAYLTDVEHGIGGGNSSRSHLPA